MLAAACTPLPTTSPTTRPSRPSGSSTASNQSPPTSTSMRAGQVAGRELDAVETRERDGQHAALERLGDRPLRLEVTRSVEGLRALARERPEKTRGRRRRASPARSQSSSRTPTLRLPETSGTTSGRPLGGSRRVSPAARSHQPARRRDARDRRARPRRARRRPEARRCRSTAPVAARRRSDLTLLHDRVQRRPRRRPSPRAQRRRRPRRRRSGVSAFDRPAVIRWRRSDCSRRRCSSS